MLLETLDKYLKFTITKLSKIILKFSQRCRLGMQKLILRQSLEKKSLITYKKSEEKIKNVGFSKLIRVDTSCIDRAA